MVGVVEFYKQIGVDPSKYAFTQDGIVPAEGDTMGQCVKRRTKIHGKGCYRVGIPVKLHDQDDPRATGNGGGSHSRGEH